LGLAAEGDEGMAGVEHRLHHAGIAALRGDADEGAVGGDGVGGGLLRHAVTPTLTAASCKVPPDAAATWRRRRRAGRGQGFTQAPLRFDEARQAAMNRIPAMPSAMPGKVTAGSG